LVNKCHSSNESAYRERKIELLKGFTKSLDVSLVYQYLVKIKAEEFGGLNQLVKKKF
jgi:hypothetical protein